MGKYCPDFCVRNRPASTYWHVNCQIMNYHAISDSLASMLMLLLHHVHVKIRGEHVALRAATRSTHPDAREHQRAPASTSEICPRIFTANRGAPAQFNQSPVNGSRPSPSQFINIVSEIYFLFSTLCSLRTHTHTDTT